MLQAPLGQLVSEIDRCFDYYREESGGGKIDFIELSGGGASLKGLDKYLSEELGIEAKLGDPLGAFKPEREIPAKIRKLSYRFAPAVGAALSVDGVNLLPIELKEETKRTFKRATIQSAVTALILILVFVFTGMRIQLGNFYKRIEVAQKELLSLQPQLKDVKDQSLVNTIFTDEPYWEDIFKELSNVISDSIYLTRLSVKEKIIKIEGIIDSKEAEELLSDLILVLEEGLFNNVKLITTKEARGKSGKEFELQCWVDY